MTGDVRLASSTEMTTRQTSRTEDFSFLAFACAQRLPFACAQRLRAHVLVRTITPSPDTVADACPRMHPGQKFCHPTTPLVLHLFLFRKICTRGHVRQYAGQRLEAKNEPMISAISSRLFPRSTRLVICRIRSGVNFVGLARLRGSASASVTRSISLSFIDQRHRLTASLNSAPISWLAYCLSKRVC
jgi:hypothetical protein